MNPLHNLIDDDSRMSFRANELYKLSLHSVSSKINDYITDPDNTNFQILRVKEVCHRFEKDLMTAKRSEIPGLLEKMCDELEGIAATVH